MTRTLFTVNSKNKPMTLAKIGGKFLFSKFNFKFILINVSMRL